MKKKNKKKRKIFIIIGCVLALLGIAGFYTYRAIVDYASMPYEGEERRIFIPENISKNDFENLLKRELGEDFGEHVFNVYRKFDSDYNIPSGSYEIFKGEKAYSLAHRLAKRRQDPIDFKFNNLRMFDDLARRVDNTFSFDKDDFIEAVKTELTKRGASVDEYPSYFLPDTYEYYWTDTPERVVEKMLKNYDRFWNEERLKKAAALGLNPQQVSTLASIVEAESNMDDERPKIARLYLNRLDKNMLLQADPTVVFAVGDFSIRRVLNEHKKVESPYNTYIHKGLPPGPIRIPQASTLDMVLNAPEHDYIYMCAKEDFSGYHNFAKTLKEHNVNADKYHKALDQKKIK